MKITKVIVNKQPGQKILELGGGSNRHPSADCNVDVRAVEGVDFTCSFDELLPVQSYEWDCVLSFYVLEHISYRRVKQFVSEIYRILKPNGTVIITVPNTEAQIKWLQEHPEGWDGRDFFESVSGLLYGDQDYPDNTHKMYLNPVILHQLFEKAGFENVQVKEYGERSTDMSLVARKPNSETFTKKTIVNVGNRKYVAENEVMEELKNTPREEIFNAHYFNGGGKFGGYSREGYWDYPVHNITVQKILAKQPTSVLELGCARGYILKRIQDQGIFGEGLEVSKHCFMTRVCDGIHKRDLLNIPYIFGKKEFDLCYSVAVLEHIPEDHLDNLLEEIARVSKRSYHGIDFGENDDGFDKSHVTLKSKSWWEEKFKKYGIEAEIVDKEELEQGEYSPTLFEDQGQTKLNIGSFTTMFHHGWINVDIHDLNQFAKAYRYRFLQHDIRNGIPYQTETVDAIYTSHFLEHLDYREGVAFLRECRRVLKPNGALRVIVPSMSILTEAFRNGTIDIFRHINLDLDKFPTDAMKFHELLYSNHKSVYDQETLKFLSEQAGFVYVSSKFRDIYEKNTISEQIQIETLDSFPCLSFYADLSPKV